MLLTNRHQKIMRFEEQPHFPMEDLTDANTEMLKYTLDNNPGVDTYAENLKEHQMYMHKIADQAMKNMHIRTEYSPAELYSFSHGFCGFETISGLVKKPQAYDNTTAASRIAEYFVDTTPSIEIEYEDDFTAEMNKEILLPGSMNQPSIEEDEALVEKEHPNMEIPKDILQSLAAASRRREEKKWGRTARDKQNPDKLFIDKYSVLPEQYPNTYDVIVTMGTARRETMNQLQLRAAGALLARALQTID